MSVRVKPEELGLVIKYPSERTRELWQGDKRVAKYVMGGGPNDHQIVNEIASEIAGKPVIIW